MTQHPSGPVQLDTPVRFNDPLPDKVDVVIIGGGVMGIFSALYLARAGKSVVVCEKGRIAGEQSSRNWGWIRQHMRDEAELPIVTEALSLWENENKHAKGKLGFKRHGITTIASTEKRLEKFESWHETSNAHGVECIRLSSKQLSERIKRGSAGEASHPWISAICTPSDGKAEPFVAVPTVAKIAQSEGVTIIEDCAARALDISNGTINSVIAEKGEIGCEQVVLAGGAWSSLFARNHGINIPQLSVRSNVCKTAPLPEFFKGCATDENIAMRRREDGGYTLAGGGVHDLYIGPDAFRHFFEYLPVASKHFWDTGFRPLPPRDFPDSWSKRIWSGDEISPFERMRVLNPKPNMRHIEKIRQNFAKRFPDIGLPKIDAAWAGMIDTMPDIVPIIDRASELPQLVIATGGSGHGFGIGPGIGRIVSNMITEKPIEHDISRFRYSRFFDGSKLVPGPAI